MELTNDFKEKILAELIKQEDNYGGTKSAYAKKFGLRADVYSTLKKRNKNNLITTSKWIDIARILNIEPKNNNWKVVKTDFYKEIENIIKWCQIYQQSIMLVDKCGIGKTESSRHIVKFLKNAFYVDCSQAKQKIQFMRLLAKTIGVESNGKYIDVKENIKYGLKLLETPVIILDEYGDLEYSTFLEIKELQNATPGMCGWFAMGANGLKQKIIKGIEQEKQGFAESFDRFSGEIVTITPTGRDDFKAYMRNILIQVAVANNDTKIENQELVIQCIKKEGSIRKLKTLIQISNEDLHN